MRLSQAVADLQVLADSRLGELCALQSRLEATLKEVEDLRARVMVGGDPLLSPWFVLLMRPLPTLPHFVCACLRLVHNMKGRGM